MYIKLGKNCHNHLIGLELPEVLPDTHARSCTTYQIAALYPQQPCVELLCESLSIFKAT